MKELWFVRAVFRLPVNGDFNEKFGIIVKAAIQQAANGDDGAITGLGYSVTAAVGVFVFSRKKSLLHSKKPVFRFRVLASAATNGCGSKGEGLEKMEFWQIYLSAVFLSPGSAWLSGCPAWQRDYFRTLSQPDCNRRENGCPGACRKGSRAYWKEDRQVLSILPVSYVIFNLSKFPVGFKG